MNTKVLKTNKNKLFRRNKIMKTTKVLLAFVLALFLSLGSIIPVLAGPVIQDNGKEESLPAAIAKILKMPIGVDTPNTTFEFVITKISYDDDTSNEAKDKMPNLGPNDNGIIKIPFDRESYWKLGSALTNDADVKYAIVESANIFAGTDFNQAGIYVYEISEKNITFTNTDLEKIEFSQAVYELYVYVKQAADGSYYIYGLYTVLIKSDSGGLIDNGPKADPTPKDPEYNGGDCSGLAFTNTYTKKNGGGSDPEDPAGPDPETDESSMYVSKAITGDFSRPDVYFSYEMKFINNSLVTANYDFIAYILNVDEKGVATLVNAADLKDVAKNNVSGTVTGNEIKVNSSDTLTFSLKANQRIAFFGMHIGSSYTLKENSATGYTPKVAVTYYDAGVNAMTTKVGIEAENAAIMIPNNTAGTNISGPLYIGETGNKAEFLNKRDSITPTGLNLNDLPFIGMIVIAIAGVTGFIAYKILKNKKSKNSNDDYEANYNH